MVEFEFIPKFNEVNVCPEWMSIKPIGGILTPGEKVEISITVLVDRNYSMDFNTGKQKIEHILILHLKNGKDTFVKKKKKSEQKF